MAPQSKRKVPETPAEKLDHHNKVTIVENDNQQKQNESERNSSHTMANKSEYKNIGKLTTPTSVPTPPPHKQQVFPESSATAQASQTTRPAEESEFSRQQQEVSTKNDGSITIDSHNPTMPMEEEQLDEDPSSAIMTTLDLQYFLDRVPPELILEINDSVFSKADLDHALLLGRNSTGDDGFNEFAACTAFSRYLQDVLQYNEVVATAGKNYLPPAPPSRSTNKSMSPFRIPKKLSDKQPPSASSTSTASSSGNSDPDNDGDNMSSDLSELNENHTLDQRRKRRKKKREQQQKPTPKKCRKESRKTLHTTTKKTTTQCPRQDTNNNNNQ